MSKLQEKIEFYSLEATKLDIKLDADLFGKVTKGLGPSIYKQDAEVVSCSQADELATVKKNFLLKKLGLEDTEALDTAIATVCEVMGKSNKKNTVLFSIIYWLKNSINQQYTMLLPLQIKKR